MLLTPNRPVDIFIYSEFSISRILANIRINSKVISFESEARWELTVKSVYPFPSRWALHDN